MIENDISLEILTTLTVYIKGYLDSLKLTIEKELVQLMDQLSNTINKDQK